jgi:hypothetical protein
MNNRLCFTIIWISLIPFTLFAQNQDSVSGDRAALVDLYNATGGSGWDKRSAWNSSSPLGNWYGVETDSQGRVVRLNLAENNLRGELPSSIGNLSRLRYINIKQNSLAGRIPSSIGNWREIEWLLLSGRYAEDPNPRPDRSQHPGKSDESGNEFSGVFPDVWGSFTSLRYVEISGSSLTEIIHSSIGHATELLQIHMSWNKKNDKPLPAEINNLTKLQKFYYTRSAVTGSFPDISNLTDLRYLNIGSPEADDSNANPGFTGALPDFSNNTMLKEIILDQHEFTGDWPHYWNNGQFNNLRQIRATFNNLTGTMHGFENLNLVVFSVSNNNIGGTIPASVTTNSDLIIIHFGNNNFTGQIPQTGWDGWNRLRYMDFSRNNLTGPIPDRLPGWDVESTSDIYGSRRWQFLDFRNNNLSGPISTNHAHYMDESIFDSFEYMDIRNNAFSESDYRDLQNLMGSKLRTGGQDPSTADGSGDYEGYGDDSDGDDGGYEDEFEEVPDAPAIVSPDHLAEDVSLNLRLEWSEVYADEYILHMDRDGDSQYFYSDQKGVTITETTYTFSEETLPGTTHYWRVRGVKDGIAGDWSPVSSFTTIDDESISDSSETGTDDGDDVESGDENSGEETEPDVPELLSPENDAEHVSITPTFSWDEVEADYYILQADEINGGGNNYKNVFELEVESSEFTSHLTLKDDREHQWRVKAIKNGKDSEWSPRNHFKTEKLRGGGGGGENPNRPPNKQASMEEEESYLQLSVADLETEYEYEDVIYFNYDWRESGESMALINYSFDVAPYELDEYYTRDYTTNQNHAYFDSDISTPRWNVNGRSGRAIRFDGVEEFLYIPTSSLIDALETFTVETWISHEGWGSEHATIFNKPVSERISENPGSVYTLKRDGNSGRISFEITLENDQVISVTSRDEIPANEWVHVTATFNGSELRLYLDGQEEDSRLVDAPLLQTNSSRLYLGSRWSNSTNANRFNGSLDEFRLYERVLSKEQIQAHAAGEYHRLSYRELLNNETWSAAVTTNNGIDEGETLISEVRMIYLDELGGETPEETTMNQNYPNPFNPTTQIRFTISESQQVSLKIYNLAGQLVATLIDGSISAGTHQTTFSADHLASGIYFYRLITENEIITRQMTFLK